jgi:hypothetical protein
MINLIYNDIAAQRHFRKIEVELRNRINNVMDDGILIEKVRYYPTSKDHDFLEYLLNGDKLEKLITLRPENMTKAIRVITGKFDEVTDKSSKFHHIVYNIFISSIYNNTERFDKLDFIEQIQVDTCPYCNRSYIYYLSKDKKIKPELDHFYPKDIYPYFGMSFYNLIPSCQTCNGFGAKSKQDPASVYLTNPYLINPDDFEFTYEPVSGHILSTVLDKKSIKVIIRKKLPGHLDVFRLDDLYAQHADHILELIIKSQVKYSDSYRKYLKRYADKGLTLSDHEIDRMILGNYAKTTEIHLRPLAKMYQDIGKQLGLIK